MGLAVGEDGAATVTAERDQETEDPAPRDELNEIMAELRVMVQGIQVIFAFLLTIPFTGRFSGISQTQQSVYFLAFVSAAGAISLLIAPSAIHRVQRHPTRAAMDRLLRTSTILIICGSVLMTIAITAVVFLVTDLIYDRSSAAIIAGMFLAVTFWLWFVLPILRVHRAGRPW